MRKTIILMSMMMLLLAMMVSAVNITDCSNITNDLNQDLEMDRDCQVVEAIFTGNYTLDCKGYTLNLTNSDEVIVMNANSPTIDNCIINIPSSSNIFFNTLTGNPLVINNTQINTETNISADYAEISLRMYNSEYNNPANQSPTYKTGQDTIIHNSNLTMGYWAVGDTIDKLFTATENNFLFYGDTDYVWYSDHFTNIHGNTYTATTENELLAVVANGGNCNMTGNTINFIKGKYSITCGDYSNNASASIINFQDNIINANVSESIAIGSAGNNFSKHTFRNNTININFTSLNLGDPTQWGLSFYTPVTFEDNNMNFEGDAFDLEIITDDFTYGDGNTWKRGSPTIWFEVDGVYDMNNESIVPVYRYDGAGVPQISDVTLNNTRLAGFRMNLGDGIRVQSDVRFSQNVTADNFKLYEDLNMTNKTVYINQSSLPELAGVITEFFFYWDDRNPEPITSNETLLVIKDGEIYTNITGVSLTPVSDRVEVRFTTLGGFSTYTYREKSCIADVNCTSTQCVSNYTIQGQTCDANYTCVYDASTNTGVLAGTVCDGGSSVNANASKFCDIIQDCIEYETVGLGYFRGYTTDQTGNCINTNRQTSPANNFNASEGLIIGTTEEAIVDPDNETCSEGYDEREPSNWSIILFDTGGKILIVLYAFAGIFAMVLVFVLARRAITNRGKKN